MHEQNPEFSLFEYKLLGVSRYMIGEAIIFDHLIYLQSELYPRLIQDVRLMINELENVTVLWEELWLSTLQDLHTGRPSMRLLLFIMLLVWI